jgi:hypothetical protein
MALLRLRDFAIDALPWVIGAAVVVVVAFFIVRGTRETG